ncbi:hypothetical protein K6959_00750 [Bacillus aquiflavi]|uniref:hypothetical protein n=1 Tax=Bacillus aquiflavi TaxID=2672567 RepID=UPI001CA8CB56|nr:hypothetical protein [Bacillus aquiflavi]UAC48567.1 hypothetical protein K6959_00750 [Bacillus aquiflavi]
MDWIFISFTGVFFITIILMILLLYSLSKHGDERKEYIKTKTMSYTFTIIIGLLLTKKGEDVYVSITNSTRTNGFNAYTFLVTITTVYFVVLLINKKRFGG